CDRAAVTCGARGPSHRGRMNEATSPALPLRERRDRIVERLCRHFANDDLTLEEFERRLDLAHRARDAAERDALLDGLPASPGPAATPAPARPAADARPARATAIAIMGGIDIFVPPGVVVESEGIAILGGFDHAQGAATAASPDAPILRIRGLAF